MQRRAFLAGLGALVAAPAVIRTPGLLMPVRAVPLVSYQEIMRDAVRLFSATNRLLRDMDRLARKAVREDLALTAGVEWAA